MRGRLFASTLLVAAGKAGFEHVFFEAAFFEEVFFQTPDLLVEEVVGLVDEADDYVCYDFWRPGFEIGPIGLIGHIFFGAEFSNKEGFAGIFVPQHRSADS